MCPMPVVILAELRQEIIQMLLPEDDEPRKALGFNGPNKLLAASVEVRRSDRQWVWLQAILLQELREPGGVFHIPIMQQNRRLRSS